MSDYALFNAWNKSLRWGQGCGMTAGDTVYCRLQIYDEPFPCPNGLPIRNTLPRDVPFMVARVERARRDAAIHAEHIDWQERVREAHREWSSDDVVKLKELSEGMYDYE